MNERLSDIGWEDIEKGIELPVACGMLGKVLFQKVVTSWTVGFWSTRIVRNFGSTGPCIWLPAPSSRRRYSMISFVIRSPGHRIGMPGGYGVTTSAQTLPALSLRGISTWSERKASRGVATCSGIGGKA